MIYRTKGFTMVEVLIYMGIMSILLVTLTNTFSQIVDTRIESEATSSVEQDGSYILARLFYDIGRAQSMSLPASAGASGGVLQLSINGVPYSYSANSGVLELTTNTGTDQLTGLDTTISNLTFLRIGNASGKHTVRISFTLSSRAIRSGGPEIRNYQTTVGLR